MSAGRRIGALFVVLASGCAHRAEAPPSTTLPTEDPLTQLRRDNAALRRRVQMLEDRVLYLEQGREQGREHGREHGRDRPGAISTAAGTVAGQHTLADGRSLPIVRLSPQQQGMRGDPSDDDRDPHARAALDPEPASRGDDGWDAPATPAARSFRLEGSRLVHLATKAGPAAPDRPDRSARGTPIIEEYEAAMAIYESGQVQRAEAAFAAFARKHPRHDYADNALYWKGEAAYDQHHYGDALAAFTEVVERYGGGNKAPDALLKIGLCYRQLGDLPNARDVLTELVAAYPGERASDIARVKLAELES